LSIDLFDGSDYSIDGSDSTSVGVGIVQYVDAYNLEVYAGWRDRDFDAPGTDYEDIDVYVIGARWKF
jgi:hypothetical protein